MNEDGISTGPSLSMKPESNTGHLRCDNKVFKCVCPKMSWDSYNDDKYHSISHCENPCTV